MLEHHDPVLLALRVVHPAGLARVDADGLRERIRAGAVVSHVLAARDGPGDRARGGGAGGRDIAVHRIRVVARGLEPAEGVVGVGDLLLRRGAGGDAPARGAQVDRRLLRNPVRLRVHPLVGAVRRPAAAPACRARGAEEQNGTQQRAPQQCAQCDAGQCARGDAEAGAVTRGR